MCMVSMVADYGMKLWDPKISHVETNTVPITPNQITFPWPKPAITEDQIKKWIDLAVAAKEFDKATNQPDCETPEKMEFVEKLYGRLRMLSGEFDSLADEIEVVFKLNE